MCVIEDIQTTIADLKERLRPLVIESIEQNWELESMSRAIHSIIDRTPGEELARFQEATIPQRTTGHLDRFKECVSKSAGCEADGDTVLGVFITVPDAMIGDAGTETVYNMLRNEFAWWEEMGMARLATEDEVGRDKETEQKWDRLSASLGRVETALTLAE